jgi:hypothetical protein
MTKSMNKQFNILINILILVLVLHTPIIYAQVNTNTTLVETMPYQKSNGEIINIAIPPVLELFYNKALWKDLVWFEDANQKIYVGYHKIYEWNQQSNTWHELYPYNANYNTPNPYVIASSGSTQPFAWLNANTNPPTIELKKIAKFWISSTNNEEMYVCYKGNKTETLYTKNRKGQKIAFEDITPSIMHTNKYEIENMTIDNNNIDHINILLKDIDTKQIIQYTSINKGKTWAQSTLTVHHD